MKTEFELFIQSIGFVYSETKQNRDSTESAQLGPIQLKITKLIKHMKIQEKNHNKRKAN